MFVQFTIPRGTVELGQVIDVCVARCVEKWGGCTVTDGIGYWQKPESLSAVPCVEPVAILGVECEPWYGRLTSHAGRESHLCVVREWFDNLAVYVRVKGDQHTVYYRMFEGGEARFVGPNTIVGGAG